jgi:hypothetical protein
MAAAFVLEKKGASLFNDASSPFLKKDDLVPDAGSAAFG